MAPAAEPRWTEVADVVARLRKRWKTGRYLQAYAQDEPWQPITFPVKAPTAAALLDEFDRARQWHDRFHRDSRNGDGTHRFAVEHRTVRGRGLGTNVLPSRIRIDSFGQLCALLRTTGDVRAFDTILDLTESRAPSLRPWVTGHPILALEHRDVWPDILSAVDWIAANAGRDVYLRHIDLDGIDTKFVERHQRLLAQLLPYVLPADRIDATQRTFAGRHGLREKPHYTRLRLLSPVPELPAALSEVRVRTEELAAIDLNVRTVFVVENEVSYLAFPGVPDAVAIFGEGFGLATLERVRWLHDKELVYWGDIDTHGFVMLDRLRTGFPTVRSILMDHETLLAHPTQLVKEPEPTNVPLPHLTAAERSLYQDLVEDRFGPAVRLEQERIRFGLVQAALRPWIDPSASGVQ